MNSIFLLVSSLFFFFRYSTYTQFNTSSVRFLCGFDKMCFEKVHSQVEKFKTATCFFFSLVVSFHFFFRSMHLPSSAAAAAAVAAAQYHFMVNWNDREREKFDVWSIYRIAKRCGNLPKPQKFVHRKSFTLPECGEKLCVFWQTPWAEL